MYVEESGTPGSPAIVFLHGGGQSGRIWRGHMERLSAFHCLAPDLPGFGQSNRLPAATLREIADLVAELIETRVPARRASVVSVSGAGAVVHALLDRHPDRVERAVLDGSPMFPYIAPRGVRFLMYLFLTALSPFMHTRPVTALFHETHDRADLRAASRRAILRAAWVRTLAATAAACPVLLVAEEKEGCVRPADAALATLMPHAEARFVPGLGHCWQRKAPDLHIRMVKAWFSGQELPSELRPEPAPSPGAVERLRREVSERSGATGRRSHLHEEVRISAPIEHTWEFFLDTSRWDDFDPRTEFGDISGPVDRVGTTFVETARLMSVEMKSTWTVDEVEPLRLVRMRTDTGPMDESYRFERDGEATRLVVESDYEMPGKIPGVIKDAMTRGWVERYMRHVTENFESLAEATLPIPA
jgi:pimeloyl-ACP methyl ester carboxylesterase